MLDAQGTKLEMSNGDGTPITEMTATVGNPTLITSASHGLTDGLVGALSAFEGTDCADMNGETVVVKYASTNTFSVDIDTTGKTLTASKGTITPNEYAEIGEILDWDLPGDTHNMIDKTDLGSTRGEETPGIPRGSATTFSIGWTSDDTGLLAAEVARAAKTLKTWRITYSDDATHSFTGYVTAISDSGGVDDKVSGSITIQRVGALTLA